MRVAWDSERERYAAKMRHLGTPLMVTSEEFQAAARILAKARRYGMSDSLIAEQVGVHYTLPSKVRRGAISTMKRATFEKVMTLKPQRPVVSLSSRRGKVGSGALTGSIGTVRRLQALRADGFPGHLLGSLLGVSYEAVAQLAKGTRSAVLESTRIDVARVYSELEGKVPGDFGVPANQVGRCSTWARKAGYATRACWDAHTIDDPAAEPEWTGYCGTPLGLAVHRRDGIPVCLRCEGQPKKLPFSGEKFRKLRESRGWSQRHLEKEAGLNTGHIHHWESGRYSPKLNTLMSILSVLDATFEDVCEESEST